MDVIRYKTRIRRLYPVDEITKLGATLFSRSRAAGKLWSLAQGPIVPTLLAALDEEVLHRDLLVFFSLLYHPTLRGLARAASRSALVPLVHEEPPIYTRIAREALQLPRALLVNTEEELALIARVAGPLLPPSGIEAVGRDEPPPREDNRLG